MLQFLIGLSENFEGIQIFAVGLAFTLAIVFALTFHEFAHAFVAYKAGDNTPKAQGRLTLNPLKHISPLGALMFLLFGFGWAKPVEINPLKFRNYKKASALVSIAGIVTNLILAFVSIMAYSLLKAFVLNITNYFVFFIIYFFYFSAILNVSLALFNLLPIYPLDGFKFLQVLLKPNNKFIRFMYQYGQIVLLIFILTPIFDILFSYVINFVLNLMIIIPSLLI
ncbi:MAG: site-2 protease family protein [Christensenellales bacterium]|jgi:Zn-dependent protease